MPAHWTTRTRIQHRLRRLAERETFAAWPIAEVTAWFTPDYVPARSLELGQFAAIQPTTDWGADGAKGYFRLRFAIPPELDGRSVRLIPDTGGEGLCFRDGEPWQAVDWAHPEIDLSETVRAGETFDLVIEARPTRTYWGFGFPPGQPSDPAGNTVRLGVPRLVAVNRPVRALARAGRLLDELAEQLLDSTTTATPLSHLREQFYYELASPVPGGSFRGEQILRHLDDALDRIDLLADDETLGSQAAEAMAILQSVLAQAGAPHRFVVNASPNSHLDVAWVWTLEETVRKSARTLTTTVRLLERYSHYTFMQTSPILLDMVRTHFPALFERARAAVASGRLEIAGSMWVEPDLNLPGGESLVRQLLLGDRFLRDELGVTCRLLYIPDAFGDTGALPQILAQAGIPYFMTVKINTNDRSQFPHSWFWWEGIDGSRVLAHQPPSLLDGPLAPAMLLDVERRFPQHGQVGLTIRPWGLSDGGGGPTEEDVERLGMAADLDGLPLVTAQRADTCFATKAAEGSKLPVWRGELYFERHRGTYTTHAVLKSLSRRVEGRLYEAELLAALTGSEDTSELREQWRLLCTHQFHDVITGNSIAEVSERAVSDLRQLLDTLESQIEDRLEAIAGAGDGLLVWNPLSWVRDDIVAIPSELSACAWTAPDGRPVPVQATGDGALALVHDVPSVGYVRLAPSTDPAGSEQVGTAGPLRWDEEALWAENGLVRLRLNRKGQVESLLDLRAGREVIEAGTVANELRLHEDIPAPGLYGPLDSVEIGEFYQDKYRSLEALEVSLVERGPVRLAWRAVYDTGRSRIEQDVRLYAHTARVEFSTRVEWAETERLLRACFPVAVNADSAFHEIQFGAVRRPTHDNTSWDQSQFEVPAQRWVDLSEDGFGVALLNDGKYGYSAKRGVLGLSLLRATRWPNPDAERGCHQFTYALFPHAGGFQTGGVVQEALALNVGLRGVRAGAGPQACSFLSISEPNVILTALKPAEDERGAILRVYEAYNRRGEVRVRGPFAEAWTASLLEESVEALAVEESSFRFAARPFGIHTFRVRSD